MARNLYGCTSADFTLTESGRVVAGATATVWSARTGGTQITDLTDLDGDAITLVTSDADGGIRFYGVDGDKDTYWLDTGTGARIAVRPADLTGEIGPTPDLTIGTVTTGTAAATITGTDASPVLNLTLPSAGANGVNTAAIQDDAVTADKIAANAVGASELADNAVNVAALDADDLGNGLVLTADSGEPSGMKWSAYGIADLDIGTVDTGTPAAASMTGNPQDGYALNLTLPPVSNGSISDIAVAADADIDPSKIAGTAITEATVGAPAIWSDFTDKTDTTSFPAQSDSGHDWQWPVAESGSPYRPVIVDGRYTNEHTAASVGATYVEADLGAGIARIGCDFSFGAGDSGTAIALAVWTEPVTDAILDPSPYIPDAPLHIVVSQTDIGIGYYDTTVQLLRTVKHPEELAKDGTIYRIEATIDGDTITVVTPFGEVITASHAFVAANPGNWACWEIFQSDADGTSKPQIARVWGEARNQDAPVASGTGGVALAALAAHGGHPVVVEKDNGSAWVSATGSWADIDASLTAVAPAPGPTGQVLVVYSAGVATTGSPILLWGLSDTATMYAISGVVNCAYNGNVTAVALATIPEGTVVTWQQLLAGTDTAATKLVGSSGDIATLALIPV